MRAVVQRVSEARVSAEGREISRIGRGLLVLLAVHAGDRPKAARKMADKIVALRIFSDAAGKMNLSLADIGGGILAVSQFTLYGDCGRGNRPSFIAAARPEQAMPIYEDFLKILKEKKVKTASGIFGAEMAVSLINDGPVTVIIDV